MNSIYHNDQSSEAVLGSSGGIGNSDHIVSRQ
jgi:hypothetical protein